MNKLVTPDLSGPVPVARITGEIDLANAVRVRNGALAVAVDDADGLVVDLAEVPYLDSSGLQALFGLARDLHQRDQALVVTVPLASPIRGLLKITNFQHVAPICDTTETAVELIAQRSRKA